MCLTHRCALWKCSQQTAPTRLPGKAPQTLQVGSIDMDGGPISWSQISRSKRYVFQSIQLQLPCSGKNDVV